MAQRLYVDRPYGQMFPERLLGRANGLRGHRAAFAFAPDMRLPEVAQPLLVLDPNDDLQVETRRAAPLIRQGRTLELPGWGHGFFDGSQTMRRGWSRASSTPPTRSRRSPCPAAASAPRPERHAGLT